MLQGTVGFFLASIMIAFFTSTALTGDEEQS